MVKFYKFFAVSSFYIENNALLEAAKKKGMTNTRVMVGRLNKNFDVRDFLSLFGENETTLIYPVWLTKFMKAVSFHVKKHTLNDPGFLEASLPNKLAERAHRVGLFPKTIKRTLLIH